MWGLFAAQDPQTILSSGNTVAILALIIITLAGVVVYLVRKLDNRDVEIKELNKLLFTEGKDHTNDYREMAEREQAVLQLNSQNSALLTAKIEAVKGQH